MFEYAFQQSERIIVPVKIHFVINSSSLASDRSFTTTRKQRTVPLSTPPNTHCSSTYLIFPSIIFSYNYENKKEINQAKK